MQSIAYKCAFDVFPLLGIVCDFPVLENKKTIACAQVIHQKPNKEV